MGFVEHWDAMSNKSSPRSRPSRSTPTSVRSGVRRPRANVAPPTTSQDPAEITAAQRLRRFLAVVGIPNLVLVLAVIVVAFAGIMFTAGSFAALPATMAEGWFALHLVPVSFQGVTLGVLPLLPALGVVGLIASSVRRAVKDRLSFRDLVTILGLVIVIPLTLSGIAWFMAWDAAKVFPLEPPALGPAILNPVLLHLLGLIFGMGPQLWKDVALHVGASEALVDGAVRALHLMARLALAATVVYAVLLLAGYQRLIDLGQAYPILSGVGIVGLIIVCLLYLANAIVGTLAVLLGGQVSVGVGSISLFSIDLVPLPVFPLFAAVPGSVPMWAPALLLIPFAILIHFAVSRAWDARTVAATAVFSGVWALLVAYLVSGQLGGYGYSGPVLWLFALLATLWVALVAGAAWGAARLRQGRTDDTELDDDTDGDPFVENENRENEDEIEVVVDKPDDSPEPKPKD